MTSKEFVAVSKKDAVSMTADTQAKFYKLEKDLEVLEILKKIKWEVYESGGGDNWYWFIDSEQSMKITEKEAKIIKEWLENDK